MYALSIFFYYRTLKINGLYNARLVGIKEYQKKRTLIIAVGNAAISFIEAGLSSPIMYNY